MWNSTNFPAKQLTKGGDGSHPYWGAVPLAMQTQAGTNDIWVANTLNRIYFGAGTSPTGGCNNTGTYTLGSPGTSPTYTEAALPSGATFCASESGTCTFSGAKEIWYGASGKWRVAIKVNTTPCNNTALGPDPIENTGKSCYYRDAPTDTNNLNTDGFFMRACRCATPAPARSKTFVIMACAGNTLMAITNPPA